MYLHLGNNVVVTQDSILGIFDLDNCSQSHLTREYLAKAERETRDKRRLMSFPSHLWSVWK